MDNIAILIPTFNRHSFLIRQFDWLNQIGVEEVFALDGSEKRLECPEIFSKWYHHLPNMPYIERLKYGIDKVKQSMAVLCADDDYLYPEGLKNAVSFLEKNADYSVSYGQYFLVFPYKNRYGIKQLYGCNRSFGIHDNDHTNRLSVWMRDYMHSFYAPRQSDRMRAIIKSLPSNQETDEKKLGDSEAANLVELAFAITDAWFGKRMVSISDIYMVRQAVERNSVILGPDAVEEQYPQQFCSWIDEYCKKFSEYANTDYSTFRLFWSNGWREYRDYFIPKYIKKTSKNKQKINILKSFKKIIFRSIKRTIKKIFPKDSQAKRVLLLFPGIKEIVDHMNNYTNTLVDNGKVNFF
ncbi:TIGR00180 family glycosyltransferase [Marispirochaeta sp.]|uniref:TIGR00180 family glycosyltransferase n=1 Tax=Marispirochaeta sp. TaxID=2038653 RepID=UPI0029C63B4F|nr:TIGR00180 family glycosyltransferase [Marispirochaeta sp.]